MWHSKTRYYEYLKSEEWKQKTDLVRIRSNNKCELCLINDHEHTHHRTYERLFRERLEDLVGICERCHLALHLRPQRNGKVLTIAEFKQILIDCQNQKALEGLEEFQETLKKVDRQHTISTAITLLENETKAPVSITDKGKWIRIEGKYGVVNLNFTQFSTPQIITDGYYKIIEQRINGRRI